MGKRWKCFNWIVSLFFAMSLPACYDYSADIVVYSGDQPVVEEGVCTNAVTYVALSAGGQSSVELGMAFGNGWYRAETSDVEIVKVAVQYDRLTLSCGEKTGEAVVIVSDEKGNEERLSVEVSQ